MMNSTLKRVSVVAVIVLSLIVSLLGCQAPASQPATPVAKTTAAPATQAAAPTAQPASQTSVAVTTAAPAPQTLKIGVQMALTGVASMIPASKWLELSVEDINATGFKVGDKTYKIEPIIVDDKFTPEGQLDAGNRLALAEKVKIIVGVTSNASTVIQPVTEPAKVLMLSINPPVATIGPAHPLNLAIGQPLLQQILPPVLDSVAKDNPNLKKVATLYLDDLSARNHIRLVQESAARLGLTYVGEELVPYSIKDFNPVVLRLLQKNPDIIYTGAFAAMPTLFPGAIGALREQGFKGVAWGSNVYPTIVAPTGAKAEGFYGATLPDVDLPLVPARMKELAKRWIGKYGQQTFNADQIVLYDMFPVLVQAMQKAGTVDDTGKIAQVLRDGEWDGVAGKGRFTGTKTFGAPAVFSQLVFASKFAGGKFNMLNMIKSEVP